MTLRSLWEIGSPAVATQTILEEMASVLSSEIRGFYGKKGI